MMNSDLNCKNDEDNKQYEHILNEIQKETSIKVVNIARISIIAFCTLSWAELTIKHGDIYLISVIILVIIYFAIELLHYFTAMFISRKNYFKFHKSLKKTELLQREVDKSMSDLNFVTFIFIIIRLLILTTVTIILIFYFIESLGTQYINIKI